MEPSHINLFYGQHVALAGNDGANKKREAILAILLTAPEALLQDPTWGDKWRDLRTKWHQALQKIRTGSEITVVHKGGRSFNWDFDVIYKRGPIRITEKVEFKCGGTAVSELPQFLSLPAAKAGLLPVSYAEFYYDNYLDCYLAIDPVLSKPSREDYLRIVGTINYNSHAFFSIAKERDTLFQEKKNIVVNTSITDFLTRYSAQIDLGLLKSKIQDTQDGKVVLLWADGRFHQDQMAVATSSEFVFSGIKNGNCIVVKAGSKEYHLLLRWRNHKGVLNPAWQISLKGA